MDNGIARGQTFLDSIAEKKATGTPRKAVASAKAPAMPEHQAPQEKRTERDSEGGITHAWLRDPEAGRKNRTASRLIVRIASSVKPEAVRWLWPGKIAIGKLTLIAGDPGLGKSMITASLAAHVTSGRPWPGGGTCPPQGDVLFISAEDDPADTIRPRLDAAGADPERVHIVTGVECPNDRGGTDRRLLSLRKDPEAIAAAVRSMQACRLIIVDPVSAYLDGADSHNNAEVRALLAVLSDLAREIGAAIVVVTHLNKGSGGSALYRSTGSLAFVAAARAAWLVARDKADKDRRLFLPLKNNLGPDSSGLAYRIQEKDGVPFVEWENEPVVISADDALGRPEDTDHESTLADAGEEWLRGILALGPVASAEIKKHATDAGFTWTTIRRAQAAIGIKPRRIGGTAAEGKWVWCLPEGQESDQMALLDEPGA